MVDSGKPDHPSAPHHRPPFPRRQVVAQVVVAAIILVSGIAIGSGGTILALKDRIFTRLRLMPVDQPPGPGPDDANNLAEWWRVEYGLDDDQVQKTKETLAKQFAATRELWGRFRVMELTQRDKFAQAVKSVFTPDQFAKWQQDMEERMRHWERVRAFGGRGGGRGGPPGDRRDWPPDRRMDPNDRRGGRQGGPPRDPNAPRGDWPPDRFRGPDQRRGDGPPGPFMDRERPLDPNRPRGDEPWGPFMGDEGGRPPEPPLDPNSGPGGPERPR